MEPLDWLDDEPLACAYYPGGERCNNPTKTIALGANDAGTFFWFPICMDCAIDGEDVHSWQVAQPFGLHDADAHAK